MQRLCCASVVALLALTVEKGLKISHLELPEMKAAVVAVALLSKEENPPAKKSTPKRKVHLDKFF